MSRPDAVTAKATLSQYDPHPEGQPAMVCVDCINLGERVKAFKGEAAYLASTAALVFQSGERNADGHLHEVTAEFTISMGKKANLRKFLESWRGKTYTEEQALAGVELHKLVGHPALVSVEHRTSQQGRTYANIASIAPLPKGMPKPDLPPYERPAFYAERIAKYAEEARAFKAAAQAQHTEPESLEDMPASLAEGDDGLPW